MEPKTFANTSRGPRGPNWADYFVVFNVDPSMKQYSFAVFSSCIECYNPLGPSVTGVLSIECPGYP